MQNHIPNECYPLPGLRGKQAGSSLLEALVSLLVFSVGALGIAALQVTTVLRVDDSRQRSVAVWKAQEFVERVRASYVTDPAADLDEQGVDNDADNNLSHYLKVIGGSSLPLMASYNSQSSFRCAARPAKQCLATNDISANICSAQDMAEFDIWSIFCDPLLGVGFEYQDPPKSYEGAVSLKGFDVALLKADLGYNLYIRWIARDAEQNQTFGKVGPTDDLSRLSSQCSEEIELDIRVGMYCVKIR